MTLEEVDMMSSVEYAEWQAWYRINPPVNPWIIMGQICASIYNAGGAKPQLQPKDFMPWIKDKPKSIEQQKQDFIAYAMRTGVKKGKPVKAQAPETL